MEQVTTIPDAAPLAGFLTEPEAAGALRKSVRSLQQWRADRRGPPWVKIGNTVLYPQDELRIWVRSRLERPDEAKGRGRTVARTA
jgi:hypothetical protein